jgi:hypothetical protein
LEPQRSREARRLVALDAGLDLARDRDGVCGIVGAAAMSRGPRSTLAIFALMLASMFFLPLLPIAGAALGYVALRHIRRSGGALRGTRVATAAMVLGIVFGVVFQGTVAAIAIPTYLRSAARARSAEAGTILYAMRAALSGWVDDHGDFPDGPNAWVPPKPCCEQQDGRCPIVAEEWAIAPWKDLGFAPYEATRFQYRYTKDPLPDGARVVVEAKGDPDCAGRPVYFDLVGEKHGDGPAEWSVPRER